MTFNGRTAGLPAVLAAAAVLTVGAAGAAEKTQPNGAAAKKPQAAKPVQAAKPAEKKPISLAPKKAMKKPVEKPAMKKPVAKSVGKKTKPAKQTKAPSQAVKPAMKKTAAKTPSKGDTARWGYHGNAGPAHWGGLAKSYHTCGAGQRQSPVNLESVEPGQLQDLQIRYKVSLIRMVHTGHTVKVNYGEGSHILLGGERYDLMNFKFRTPSEHTVAGRSFPMEIQFFHRNKKGRIAIVGLLATTGPANLAARELWDRLPVKPHTRSKKTRALINARDLLPDGTAHFRYRGSLTTPPCTENVDWLILQTPVSFSEDQIVRLRGIMGENARPVQARNGRYLLQSIGG